jgi:PAS domain S-box-containing protein
MIHVVRFAMSPDMFVLSRSERATDLLMDVVPMAIIATSCDGVITHWNQTAAIIFGVHKEDAVGHRLSDCGVNWVDPNQILRFEKHMVEKRHASEDDAAFLNAEQEKRMVGLTGRFIALSQQQTPGYIITGADVTDRRAMQVQATHTQKMEAIGQLSAGIAHEINTPTQYVSDNLSFLKEGWESTHALMVLYRQAFAASDNTFSENWTTQIKEAEEKFDFAFISAEMPKAIEQANDGVKRVAKIVRAMKEFSHPDTAEKSAVDINRAIETTVTVARNEWKYVADVQTELDEKLPPVPCYAGELNQVILNLIINAAHAIKDVVRDSGQKGHITVRTCNKGEVAEISVSDTGTGIPEGIRSRVFDPFFTTKEVGKGTGQGLALAHGVVRKKHGGKIWFESEVGKGTTFFIHLPMHDESPTAGS